MYPKEEAKALREEFWSRFRTLSAHRRRRVRKPGKWVLNRTGIKALNLRFHVDREVTQVGIDLETRNLDQRIGLYEKLESLKSVLEKKMKGPMMWELEYIRENGKSVSRIYVEEQGIDIYNRDTWQRAFTFMYKKMNLLEEFFLEYRDYLKYG